MDSGSSSFTTLVLQVDTQTPGWEKSMIKILNGIPGATFKIDATGVTRVSGNIGPGNILKLLAKAGKHVQMYWIDSGNTQQQWEKRDNNNNNQQLAADPHGRYWPDNNYYHQYHHPLPPLPPPPPFVPPYPLIPGQQFYAGEAPQCSIM